MLLASAFYIMFFLFGKKKNSSLVLYTEALRQENEGRYAEALLSYEQVLQEQKKLRFRDTRFTNAIHDKIRVLHTIISYNSNFQVALRKTAV